MANMNLIAKYQAEDYYICLRVHLLNIQYYKFFYDIIIPTQKSINLLEKKN